ncbi:MAG: methyltransferase [Bryobacteraceae bacterium]|nr:methyltransferase [Bryobacteraceae bacterium]
MLQLKSDEQFRVVRDLLDKAEYTEAHLCSRFGIENLEKFEDEFDRSQIDDFEKDATGVLIQLFVEGHFVDVTLAERHFGSEVLQAMADLGMVERNPSSNAQISSTVALYPTAGVHIVSDRWNLPDRSSYKPREDVVYPAIVSNAQRFLKFLPGTECRTFLELCSGTAFAGLHAAERFAGHVWAFDISDRSTLFGEFNRRLNGIANATVASGDLYAPADGLKFERIVAHPPYVPVLRPKWIYHDGGEDGEQIVRRCVAELPGYLEPGGIFYLLAMASDREDAPYEQRVRSWLGEQEQEFDIAVFATRSLDPEEFAVRAVMNSENSTADYREFRRLFRSLGVKDMIYAVLMIQRRAETRPVFTIRRQTGPGTRSEQILNAMAWETSLASPDGLERMMQSRPKANEQSELRVRHRMTGNGWEIDEYMLRGSFPFSMEARTDPWAPYLMAQCDGTKTVVECFENLKTQEAIPSGADATEFARALAVLVSGGFLQLEQ